MMARSKTGADTLDRAQLSGLYGYALNVIYGIPALSGLFEKAVAGQWDKANFIAQLESTDWWKNNSEYARKALAAQAAGGADWNTTQDTAREIVSRRANALGAKLSNAQLNTLVSRYIFEGWGESNRSTFLDNALSEEVTVPPSGLLAGQAGDIQSALRATATKNGRSYTDGFYLSAAKSIEAGLSTQSDYERQIRSEAATLYPMWKDKIMAGSNVYDLASGYINTMAQTMETDPNSITLDNPYIKAALQNSKGNDGTPMGLWDFQKMLRNDPKWMQTKQATDEMSSTARSVLSTFGFMG